MRLPKKSNFFCFNFHTTLIPDDPVDKLLSKELGVRALFLLHKTMQSHTKMCLSMCATNKKRKQKINFCAWFFNDNNCSSPNRRTLNYLKNSTQQWVNPHKKTSTRPVSHTYYTLTNCCSNHFIYFLNHCTCNRKLCCIASFKFQRIPLYYFSNIFFLNSNSIRKNSNIYYYYHVLIFFFLHGSALIISAHHKIMHIRYQGTMLLVLFLYSAW